MENLTVEKGSNNDNATHVLLRSWQDEQSPAFKDLNELGFGGSITGDKFSAIHGDLHTELFNREA